MKRLLLLTSLMFYSISHCQSIESETIQKDSIVVRQRVVVEVTIIEFDKDSAILRKAEEEKLHFFLMSKKNFPEVKILIKGHTDSDGSEAYNKVLSQKRSQSVLKVVKSLIPSIDSVSVESLGELSLLKTEENEDDKQRNRRVEVEVSYLEDYNEVVLCAYKRLCLDTIVKLSGGTLLELTTCQWRKIKNCASFTEFITAEQIREANLETMDEENQVLASAGMFKFNFCDSTFPVKTLIPVNENCFSPGMRLYNLTENGWSLESKLDVPIVESDGRRYYELSLMGSGMINLDQLQFPDLSPPKMRFKAGENIVLDRVIVSCDCPITAVAAGPKNKRGKQVVMPRVCCREPEVAVLAHTPDGKTLTIKHKPLSKIQHLKRIGGCKQGEKWRFLIFRKRIKVIHRKYRIRLIDFE